MFSPERSIAPSCGATSRTVGTALVGGGVKLGSCAWAKLSGMAIVKGSKALDHETVFIFMRIFVVQCWLIFTVHFISPGCLSDRTLHSWVWGEDPAPPIFGRLETEGFTLLGRCVFTGWSMVWPYLSNNMTSPFTTSQRPRNGESIHLRSRIFTDIERSVVVAVKTIYITSQSFKAVDSGQAKHLKIALWRDRYA